MNLQKILGMKIRKGVPIEVSLDGDKTLVYYAGLSRNEQLEAEQLNFRRIKDGPILNYILKYVNSVKQLKYGK